MVLATGALASSWVVGLALALGPSIEVALRAGTITYDERKTGK